MTHLARRAATALLGTVLVMGTAAPAMAATGSTNHKVIYVGQHPAATKTVAKKKAVKHVAKKKATKKKVVVKKKPVLTAPTATAATLTAPALSAYEARLLVDVNAARADAGLGALRITPGSTDVARRWTLKLADDGTLSHNPDLVADMSKAGSSDWHALAENVGMGTGDDADEIFDAYMHSPGHKANILSASARFIGIGAVETGGVTYDTMDFTDYYDAHYGAARTDVVTVVAQSAIAALAALWGAVL